MNVSPSSASISSESAVRPSTLAFSGFAIATGTLIGLMVLAVAYVYPEGSPRLNIATTTAFLAVFGAVTAIFLKMRTTPPTGWSGRFAAGLGVTMALYSSALVLALASGLTSPLVWIPVAIVVALPAALLGSVGFKR